MAAFDMRKEHVTRLEARVKDLIHQASVKSDEHSVCLTQAICSWHLNPTEVLLPRKSWAEDNGTIYQFLGITVFGLSSGGYRVANSVSGNVLVRALTC